MRQKFVIVFAVLALLGVLFHQKNPLTRAAQSYSQEVALVASGTLISLRAFNGLLSTAEQIEFEGGAVLASASVQPLKMLEPIDDAVERVASAIFVLVITARMMAVGFAPVSLLGCVLLLASALLLCMRGNVGTERFALKLGTYGVFCTLILPVTFIIAMMLGDAMLNDAWSKHNQIVESAATQYSATPVEKVGENSGFLSSLGNAKDQMAHYYEAAKGVAQRAGALIDSLITLVSLYIFKMLVLPGIMLLGFVALLRNFPAHELALYLTRKHDQDAGDQKQEQT